jgi:hypothetical protein
VTVEFSVGVDAPGAGTPTGSVTVSDGGGSCTSTVAAGQCTITLTTAGSRLLTASYAGNSNFGASTSGAEQHTVNPPSGSGGGALPNNPPSSPSGALPAGNPPLAHVSGASQTNRRFRISIKSKLVRVSRRRPPVGTTFKYTLDRAAAVRFDFIQPGSGRKVNAKCVPPKKRNRGKPKCTLRRGSLTFAGHAGLNTVRFNGWLSRQKKLTPANYTLVMTAITPGVGETSQRLRFRIVQ